jgi:cyclopropane-fatty-acyl-phospholipid synthase
MPAGVLSELFELLLDRRAPLDFRGYDGSSVKRPDAVAVIEARSPKLFGHLLRAPIQLGLVRAYVTGALDVQGDLHAALRVMFTCARRPRAADAARLLAATAAWRGVPGALVPAEEAPARWRRGLLAHTRGRDAAAIAHHYDLSNRFYRLLLGPSMAYSCAVFERPTMTLEQAQAEKFDLVCRKLDLRPGQRLLDVGAGWGGMVIHAAANYGVRAIGVTLSRAQADWAQRSIADAGLSKHAQVRQLDCRDLGGELFDAISSIGAMEHFGTRQLGRHFGEMAARLRPEGRMLNHCITRPSNREGHRPGPFIDRYVFPDGELQGPGMVIGAMHDHGFEVRHEESLREHYALTLRAWGSNLESNWTRAVAEVGEQRARVWRLYMAACCVGFELNHVQIHQMLGVRTSPSGRSGMPLRPDFSKRGERQPNEEAALRAGVRRRERSVH